MAGLSLRGGAERTIKEAAGDGWVAGCGGMGAVGGGEGACWGRRTRFMRAKMRRQQARADGMPLRQKARVSAHTLLRW